MQENNVREIEELIGVFEKVRYLDFDALASFRRKAYLVIHRVFSADAEWFLTELDIINFHSSVIGSDRFESEAWESGDNQMTEILNLMKEQVLKQTEDLSTVATLGKIEAVSTDSKTPSEAAQDRRKVFVVHGRNDDLTNAMFDFLRSLDLNPMEWEDAVSSTGEGTPYIGRILDTAFNEAQAVVVLMTPDDEARLRYLFVRPKDKEYEHQLTPQARPNVLFEAGLAMGRDPKRTILVEVGSLRPFSDIGGRHTVRLDNSPERRRGLATRLITAGCAVNDKREDWLTKGDFELKGLISDDGKITLPSSDADAERDQWGKTLAREAVAKGFSQGDLGQMLRTVGASFKDLRVALLEYKKLKPDE